MKKKLKCEFFDEKLHLNFSVFFLKKSVSHFDVFSLGEEKWGVN